MPNTYAIIICVDYSSAFNTIVPPKLYNKLILMNIDVSMCHWILDFLLNRPQFVKINSKLSTTITLNTGAPQGCVLSPLLFSLFTNDCVSTHPSVCVIKFSDDTTVEGLIQNADESMYRAEVERLAGWCEENNIELNVSKTKEIVIDFRKNKPLYEPLSLMGKLEIVTSFQFLGTVISDNLCWDKHIMSVVSKAQQRMFFFLR
eukprot:TRINITY_DN12164_c1_g1_i2.p1 TRINITY_DN12164_c1_g1~~TRINITY_DN12164_c1_g1_i2.p1  ORF type:complete len:203 (+),score=27.45 TRINITY_DN12164_c1_g1_i2:2-610(+)